MRSSIFLLAAAGQSAAKMKDFSHMSNPMYEWVVVDGVDVVLRATRNPRLQRSQPKYHLDFVLNDLEEKGWEIFQIIAGEETSKVHVIARKLKAPAAKK